MMREGLALEYRESGARMLWRRPWLLVAGVLAGALLGFEATQLMPPLFEATATVQVGQVGTVKGETRAAETAANAVTRLKVPAIQEEALRSLGIATTPDDPNAELYRHKLVARVLDKTSLFSIRARARSTEEAEKFIRATVTAIASQHDAMMAPMRDRLAAQLVDAQKELREAETERGRMATVLANPSARGASFGEQMLAAEQLAKKTIDVRELRERELLIQEQLRSENSFATQIVGRVVATDRVVAPTRAVWVLAGALIGLALAALFVLFARR